MQIAQRLHKSIIFHLPVTALSFLTDIFGAYLLGVAFHDEQSKQV